MIQGANQNVTNRLTLDRVSCSLDKDELRRLLSILQERANAAADLEIASFQQLDQTDEIFAENKNLIREAFDLRITVTGQNGQELYGPVDEVFDSPNYPVDVKFVYINSENVLKGTYNYTPHNSFEIFFDFSKPDIFDFTIFPSQPTPNETNIKVRGRNATWANGVFREIQQFLSEHAGGGSWLHKHSVYDGLLWFLGYPLVFWICFKLSPVLPGSGDSGPFIKAALYVYVALVVLVGLRALFHYARWVFPTAEYRGEKSRSGVHKATLWALTLGLIGSFLYDILKSLFDG